MIFAIFATLFRKQGGGTRTYRGWPPRKSQLMKTNMKISSARFAGSSTQVSQKPARKLPEFAFIGRSNVGKSSLINMLCGNGKLAMTSGTPGKTKLVNHFLINDSWYLVDLPGYGFAKLPEKERAKLKDVIRDYLNHSQEMVMLFVLIDIRHDIGKIDMDFLNELGGSDIPFAIIFTKGDKLGPVARAAQLERDKEQLSEFWEELPLSFVSSSSTGLGKDEILDYIGTVLNSRKQTNNLDNEHRTQNGIVCVQSLQRFCRKGC